MPTSNSSADRYSADKSAAREAVWLRPKSVMGFSAADFQELDEGQKTDLQNAVDEFSQVAGQVRPEVATTPEQLSTAAPAFETVLSILHRYLGKGPEEIAIEEALRSIHFPDWVVNWDFELGNDHYDEPAIFLNLFMANDDSPRIEMIRSANDAGGAVREVLTGLRYDRYPYMRVRRAI